MGGDFVLRDALLGALAQFDDLPNEEYRVLSKAEYQQLETAVSTIETIYKAHFCKENPEQEISKAFKKKKLNPGDVVMIYEDFITEKKVEGRAKLVEFVKFDADYGAEVWHVHFLSDDEGVTYIRSIKRKVK